MTLAYTDSSTGMLQELFTGEGETRLGEVQLQLAL